MKEREREREREERGEREVHVSFMGNMKETLD
jgi:hypothetical protein